MISFRLRQIFTLKNSGFFEEKARGRGCTQTCFSWQSSFSAGNFSICIFRMALFFPGFSHQKLYLRVDKAVMYANLWKKREALYVFSLRFLSKKASIGKWGRPKTIFTVHTNSHFLLYDYSQPARYIQENFGHKKTKKKMQWNPSILAFLCNVNFSETITLSMIFFSWGGKKARQAKAASIMSFAFSVCVCFAFWWKNFFFSSFNPWAMRMDSNPDRTTVKKENGYEIPTGQLKRKKMRLVLPAKQYFICQALKKWVLLL